MTDKKGENAQARAKRAQPRQQQKRSDVVRLLAMLEASAGGRPT
jgi:hypothetical protein